MACRTVEKVTLRNEPYTLKQYASSVVMVSSQYCNRYSISYCARNILGGPSIFPKHGDLPQAFAMRTYGKWWQKAPSYAPPIMPQTLHRIQSQDFMDLSFEESVIPRAIVVYETYHPGAIVRLWVADDIVMNEHRSSTKWYLVYEAEPARVATPSRKFMHVFDKPFVASSRIRIEFSHAHLDYYCQFDAVELHGWKMPSIMSGNLDLSKVKILDSVPIVQPSVKRMDEAQDCTPRTDVFPLSSLPIELLLKIASFLDLASLCRLSRVSRQMMAVARDPSLYTELNVREYWARAAQAIVAVAPRCTRLKKLDVSWAVGVRDALKYLLSTSECRLTHFRADSVDVDFPDDCSELEELSIACMDLNETLNVRALLQCCHLVRLNLYNTPVEQELLVTLLRRNTNLKHLNLGSCTELTDLDYVTKILAEYNTLLESLDLWKTNCLTANGVENIANLVHLRELDLGWSLATNEIGDGLLHVVTRCPRLTKLFLGACRSLCARDVLALVDNCPLLRQLDLVGIPIIDANVCALILSRMHHLELLDINFCTVNDKEVDRLRQLYPAVSIKSSHPQN